MNYKLAEGNGIFGTQILMSVVRLWSPPRLLSSGYQWLFPWG